MADDRPGGRPDPEAVLRAAQEVAASRWRQRSAATRRRAALLLTIARRLGALAATAAYLAALCEGAGRKDVAGALAETVADRMAVILAALPSQPGRRLVRITRRLASRQERFPIDEAADAMGALLALAAEDDAGA